MKIEKVRREIIEGKVLTALNEEGKVAILATKQDLEDLIYALTRSTFAREGDNLMLITPRIKRIKYLLDGIERLFHEAFL